ncbi:MAG TPA: cytochrome c oxidase subunit 3 family protein [Bryobacteraceae bacterium]|nr:cytochrome c oxidase subunit 3 family protein [Bryobacteraceae bacterium]
MADTHVAPAEHSPHLRHHFDDMAQQFDSATLGMWVFLLTEIMFFGGMFGAYTVYRSMYPEAFASTSLHMNPAFGAANTAVLIVSSLFMALAVRSARLGNQKLLQLFLVITMIFGIAFLVIKGFEYHEHWVDNKVPLISGHWDYSNDAEHPHQAQYAQQAQILFCFYFFMTGFHAVHMLVGVGIMITILMMARKGTFSAQYFTPVEISGLYWHFVDIVWIFLFPLLYLIGNARKLI